MVGLGNPGSQYAPTRHNVGAWYVDALARQESLKLKSENKFHASAAKLNQNGEACWLAIPTTYMNESGRAVAALARFYKIPVERILIAHDELDFPAGTVRIKKSGGHGGHNGLRDIISHLGSKDFLRLRIGIGHPGHKDRVTPYVLGKPSSDDKASILQSIDEALRVVPDLMGGELERAFRDLHSD
ncbi:MAG: aminoacyl-tRNA hydrolase [Gammaproteobacteria bacterium]|nr:aminoacyl-tRNA hydrolase [Gammaproteobacteria bacterium]